MCGGLGVGPFVAPQFRHVECLQRGEVLFGVLDEQAARDLPGQPLGALADCRDVARKLAVRQRRVGVEAVDAAQSRAGTGSFSWKL